MIDLITGVPGSGKTYYSVHKLHDLITAKDKKYKHIFTNINGLDLEKCNKLANDTDYVKSFEFIDLKKHIDLEYEYHQQSKNISTSNISIIPLKFDYVSEDNLKFYSPKLLDEYNAKKLTYENELKLRDEKSQIEKKLKEDYDNYVKEKGVYDIYRDSLIIIDECHLYFEDRQDDKLIRFLSYHRHFNIDIDLITQNKNLINKKYLSFIETMYVAYPASKRFFSKSFRYKKYASYQEYHANIMGTTSLKLQEKIFTLYSSGSTVLSKSIFSKLMLPIIIGSIVVFVAFHFLTSSMEKDKPKPKPRFDNNISKQAINAKPDYQKINNQDEIKTNKTKYFAVDCFTNSCTFKKIQMTFTKKSMFALIDHFKCKVIINDVTDINYYTYVLQCDSKLDNVLTLFNNQKFGVKNENKTNSNGMSTNIFKR